MAKKQLRFIVKFTLLLSLNPAYFTYSYLASEALRFEIPDSDLCSKVKN